MFGVYKHYVPQTKGELVDLLGSMMLGAPTFVDRTGYFPRTVDTEFVALNEGLEVIRPRLGQTLLAMSHRMRALFEADPDDETGETQQGRALIYEMQEALKARRKRG